MKFLYKVVLPEGAVVRFKCSEFYEVVLSSFMHYISSHLSSHHTSSLNEIDKG